jgi:hypothetical protein
MITAAGPGAGIRTSSGSSSSSSSGSGSDSDPSDEHALDQALLFPSPRLAAPGVHTASHDSSSNPTLDLDQRTRGDPNRTAITSATDSVPVVRFIQGLNAYTTSQKNGIVISSSELDAQEQIEKCGQWLQQYVGQTQRVEVIQCALWIAAVNAQQSLNPLASRVTIGQQVLEKLGSTIDLDALKKIRGFASKLLPLFQSQDDIIFWVMYAMTEPNPHFNAHKLAVLAKKEQEWKNSEAGTKRHTLWRTLLQCKSAQSMNMIHSSSGQFLPSRCQAMLCLTLSMRMLT